MSDIQILYFEDDVLDAELVLRMLKREGLVLKTTLVGLPELFEEALDTQPIDLILCDNNLPGFDGPSALKLAKRSALRFPSFSFQARSAKKTPSKP